MRCAVFRYCMKYSVPLPFHLKLAEYLKLKGVLQRIVLILFADFAKRHVAPSAIT